MGNPTQKQIDDIRAQHRNSVRTGISIRPVERAEGDAEGEKRYELSFSSNRAIELYRFGDGFYVEEILVHSKAAMNDERMQSNAPLLFNHNRDDVLGVVIKDSTRISKGKAYCEVRFGSSARAQQLQTDVDDGILSSVSVGYRVLKEEREDITGDNDARKGVRYIVSEWRPNEVSLVSIPADSSVGFGRDLESLSKGRDNTKREEANMPNDNENNNDKVAAGEGARTENQAAMTERLATAATEARQGEATRIGAIEDALSLATTLPEGKKQELKRAAMKDGVSPAEFNGRVVEEMARMAKENPGELNAAGKLDLSKNDQKRFSVANLIGVLGGWKTRADAGFEIECSDEIRRQIGRSRPGEQSFSVPYDITHPTRLDSDINERKRLLISTGLGAGQAGELVGTDHMAGSFIENLRDKSVIMGLGVTTLTGLMGDVKIPRKTGSAAFTFKALNDNTGDTDLTFDDVTLTLRTASGAVGFSRDLVIRGTPQIEGIVMRDLALGAALALDTAAISGTGAGGNPTGITVNTATQDLAYAAPGVSWAQAVKCEEMLETENALYGMMNAFLLPPSVKSTMKTTLKDAGVSGYIMDDMNMVNGYRAVCKTSGGVNADNIVFGNFNELIIGMFGTLDIQRDTATAVASGGVYIRAYLDMDVAIRQPKAFVVWDTTAP